MSISESLRVALENAVNGGTSIYAISKATGVGQGVIGRFIRKERSQIRAGTLDRFGEYLGLELQPVAAPPTKSPSPASPRKKASRKKG